MISLLRSIRRMRSGLRGCFERCMSCRSRRLRWCGGRRLLAGRLFTSEEALRLGLVNEVVETERLEARTLELVGVLKANSPEALAATKRLLAAQNKDWLDTAIAKALAANAEARGTHDFREGVAAFLEKRKPVWGKA